MKASGNALHIFTFEETWYSNSRIDSVAAENRPGERIRGQSYATDKKAKLSQMRRYDP